MGARDAEVAEAGPRAVRRRGSVNHLAWARMTAEFLPFFPDRNHAVDRARRRYVVAKLHALRPAPFAYFLREIEAGADVGATLKEYAALPAEFIRALGGDRFAPAFHVIEGAP
jgi:hypothetical protein